MRVHSTAQARAQRCGHTDIRTHTHTRTCTHTQEYTYLEFLNDKIKKNLKVLLLFDCPPNLDIDTLGPGACDK